jgi:hypothetical protein
MFKNTTTGEMLTPVDFIILCIDEARRQYEDLNNAYWCDLTQSEQIELNYAQYVHQLENNWEKFDA